MAHPEHANSPPQSLTTPLSPRTRRRQLRNCQELGDNMTIEQYVHRSDPYRTISTPNPLPHPLKLKPAPHLSEKIRPLSDEIWKILQLHGFLPTASVETAIATKALYPAEGPINLLRVVLKANNPTPPDLDLDPAKDDLLQLLRRHGLLEVHVEILNIHLVHYPAMGCLGLDHPLDVAFERVKHQILAILIDTIPEGWQLLCPFDVACDENKPQPAIVVMVKPLIFADWSDLRARIIDLLALLMDSDAVAEVEFTPACRGFSRMERLSRWSLSRLCSL